jgi:hypothetical protein
VEEQFGTVAVICEELTTLKLADWPLKRTDEAPEKLEPLIVTLVPTPPELGLKLEIDGAGVPEPHSEYRRRFGEPVPAPVTLFGVELLIRAEATVAGDW